MDSNTSLPRLPHPQSFPTSPSPGARKRSIHAVDDAALPATESKRPLVSYDGENQENFDPSQMMNPAPEASKGLSLHGSAVEVGAQGHEDLVPGNDSITTCTSTLPAGVEAQLSTPQNPASAPATKKSMLSAATRQQEKEAKERQKAEEKARKDEEKRLKEEEKKKREAEREEEKRLKEEEKKKREAEREEERKRREEKKKAKEEEKAAKEEEKRKKEEDREKKARSQMKLNSFFAKPLLPSTSPAKAKPSLSTAPASGQADVKETSVFQSDYSQEFPDFFLQSHTTLAPSHRFERDAQALNHVRQTIDSCMTSNNDHQLRPFRPSEVFQLMPFRRRRGRQAASVKEILLRIQSQSHGDMPSGGSHNSKTGADPQNLLRKVPMKFLKFGEDVRPPYQGTYTRPVPESAANKLSRNPYHRELPDTNYDYDSEVEWEEPEEGEDLDSEEEEEVSDDGDDDMDGFLDDEDDALAGGKRRLIVGDLEPVCSGIRWAANGVYPEFHTYRIETISEAVKFPIDPFSGAYWQKPRAVDQAKAWVPQNPLGRATLHIPWGNHGPEPAVGGALPTVTSKAKRPFPPEQLDEFKQAVEGSDLSKLGLVEILKKRFPKVSKDTLKVTLDQVAVRVGQKEADKKWVCH